MRALAAVLFACTACANATSGGTRPDADPGPSCDEGTTRCDGLTIETCDDGAWVAGNDCQFACIAGACSGACEPGTMVACYTGPVTTRDVGICESGTATCAPDGTAGACAGQVLPAATEDCLTPEDDDCNGEANEGCCVAVANVVDDGGFEATGATAQTSGDAWTEGSTQFGTPLCSDAACSTTVGTGPRGGTYYAWFGGTTGVEVGSLTQTVTIPAGTANLSFYLEIPSCGTPTSDLFEVTLDDVVVFTTNATDPACDVVGYAQKIVDVSAYADGGSHVLSFRSETNSVEVTNFFVDDVTLSIACE